jgi:hypothetical protein
MTRAAACEHRKTPVRLTRTTRSHSSSVIASVGLTTFTPALLINTSSRPPPNRAASATAAATLSATTTRAPAPANASAVARPIPRPAPVTRQVRPLTSKRPLMRTPA